MFICSDLGGTAKHGCAFGWMPRFFFDVHDTGRIYPDTVGTNFETVEGTAG
jgi:hypothetical protein